VAPKSESQTVCIDHRRHPDDWPGNVARHATPRRQCGCPAIPRMCVNDIRLIYKAISSSAGRTRTYNQWINSPLLYQLSYRGRMPTGMVRVPVGVPLLRASLRVDGAQTLGHGRQPGCSNVATGVDHTDSLIR
jgi:hypothetical protein